jgi:hypothetical protein
MTDYPETQIDIITSERALKHAALRKRYEDGAEYVVLDALQVAAAKTLGRTVHNFHLEIVDAKPIACTGIHHTHIAVAGQHTEQSQDWDGRVIKNDLMNIDRLYSLRAHFQDSLSEAGLTLVSLTVVYLEGRQQFGFSVLTHQIQHGTYL